MPHAQVEPVGKVRTKIVATLGPASRDPATIRALVEAGVDVFRLNFSHGTQADHSETFGRIRQVAEESGRLLGVLQDLGGPKIRLGAIAGGEVHCALGDVFTLATEPDPADPRRLTSTYRDLPRDLREGDQVLFADGAVAMTVAEAAGGAARLVVTLAGRLRSSQGINLPGADLSLSALTDKDLVDLDWTARHEVDYVGLSFVRKAADVARLRAELDARGSHARIVAKIEKPEAVADLEAIVAEADAVMVARGDLGVEMDVARVPAIQKQIISACHRAGVPVITATQMLNSMETSNRPTRAEASDVFNAVLDGTDAVMLSGETAVGLYPVEAVSTMSRIAAEAETLLFADPASAPAQSAWAPEAGEAGAGLGRSSRIASITDAVVAGAGVVADRIGAALVVVATHSGRTALAISKRRHASPTLALGDEPANARAMALYWGVTPLLCTAIGDAEGALTFALDWARGRDLLARGDRVVLVSGTMPGSAVHNAMLVREVE